MLKLNIGGGNSKLPGFVNVDRKNNREAFPLQEKTDSVDVIRASHILEHFTYGEAAKALKEWYRVLKPGGILEISIPDFDKIAEAKKAGNDAWRFFAAGGQTDENDIHRSAWDEETLRGYLAEAGFEVEPWTGDNRDTSSHFVSTNLKGKKKMRALPSLSTGSATLPTHRPAKITAVLSCPRLGWTDFYGEAIDALSPLGITLRRFTGAFWDQCIQNVIEDLIDEGTDIVLTTDYDSVFTKEMVDRLIKNLLANPEADAMAALQVKRCSNFPLCTPLDKEKRTVETSKPFQVHTAHFGLTAIWLDALRDIPKPWFWGSPGSSGSWRDEDHVDADIYFWKKWKEHERTVFVDPSVSIGHLEVMVSGFDENLKNGHMHVKDWRAKQKLEYRTEP